MVATELKVKGDVLRGGNAMAFVNGVWKFSSTVYLQQDYKRINAKSIIGVLSMNICDGDKVSVLADGEDEEQVLSFAKVYAGQE